mgnify:CR=1 FL=1
MSQTSTYLIYLQIFSHHPESGSEGCRVDRPRVTPGVPGLPHCPRFFLGQKSIWLLGRYFFTSHFAKRKKVPIRLSISVPRKTWDKPKTWDSGHATCHLPYLHIHTSHGPLSTLQPLRLFLSRIFSDQEIKR